MPRGISRYDEVRLQGRLWTPAALRGKLALWASARLSPITTVSDKVSQWDDISGNGNHLVQSSAGNRPEFRPTGNTYSEKHCPAIHFDLSGPRYFSLTSGIPYNGANGMSVHAAVSRPDPLTYSDLFSGATGSWELRLESTGVIQVNSTWTAALFTSSAVPGASFTPMVIGGDVATNLMRVHYNGITEQSSTNPGFTTPVTTIGLNGQDSTGGWKETMHEFVATSSILTPRETQLLVGYLAWANDAVGPIAASHPFKNRPPLIGD